MNAAHRGIHVEILLVVGYLEHVRLSSICI